MELKMFCPGNLILLYSVYLVHLATSILDNSDRFLNCSLLSLFVGSKRDSLCISELPLGDSGGTNQLAPPQTRLDMRRVVILQEMPVKVGSLHVLALGLRAFKAISTLPHPDAIRKRITRQCRHARILVLEPLLSPRSRGGGHKCQDHTSRKTLTTNGVGIT